MSSLAQKLVIVTGAARRIGRALALACADAGADVVVHFHESARAAEETKQDIEALGRRAWLIEADLAEPAGAAGLVAQAAELGPLFGLVNSASIFGHGDLRTTSDAIWNQTLAINLTAPFILCRSFSSALEQGQEARIINILDWRFLRPDPAHLAYSVTKAALAALTQALAVELAPHVTVNGLALGAILPPESGRAPAGLLDRVPAARWGDLQEVQGALAFLLTGPKYITGEVLHVDGGRHLA